MRKATGSGWYNESRRHSLAAQSIKTGRKVDMPMAAPRKIPTLKPTNPFTAYGEVYNVKERFEDGGMPTENIDPDWYEYEVTLEDKDGHEIEDWDSYDETYNGVQTLSKEQATTAMNEVLNDVEKGKADKWFNLKNEVK